MSSKSRFPLGGGNRGDDDDDEDTGARPSSPFNRSGSKPDDKKGDAPKPGGAFGNRSPFGRKDDDDDDDDVDDKPSSSRIGGGSPFGGKPAFGKPAANDDDDDDDDRGSSPFGRPAGGSSPFGGNKPNDPPKPGGSGGSPFGGSKPADNRPGGGSGSSPFGGGNKPNDPPKTTGTFGGSKPADRPGGGSGSSPFGGGNKPNDPPKPGGSPFGGNKPNDPPKPGGSAFGGNKPGDKPGGSGGSPFGGNKPNDPPKSSSPFGGGNRADDKKDDRGGDKPAGGGPLGGLGGRLPFGGGKKDDTGAAKPVDKRDDKGGDKPAGGGPLGGLGGRLPFGGGKPADKQGDTGPAKPASSSAKPADKPGGGPLGGRLPFGPKPGGGDKPADKKDDKATAKPGDKPAGGGPFGGLGARLPFGKAPTASDANKPGDKPAAPKSAAPAAKPGDKPADKPAGGGPLGALGSRLPFGKPPVDKQQDDNKPATPKGTPIDPKRMTGSAPSASVAAPPKGPAIDPKKAAPGAKIPPARGEKVAKPLDRAPKQVTFQQGLSLDQKLDIVGLACILGGILIFFAVVPAKTEDGSITQAVSTLLRGLFGDASKVTFLPPLALGLWLYIQRFNENPLVIRTHRLIGYCLLMLTLAATFHYLSLLAPVANMAALDAASHKLALDKVGGGWVGDQLFVLLMHTFDEYGTPVVLCAAWVVALMLSFSVTLGEVAIYVRSFFMWFVRLRNSFVDRRRVAADSRAAAAPPVPLTIEGGATAAAASLAAPRRPGIPAQTGVQDAVPALTAGDADRITAKPSRLNPFGRAPKTDNKPADAAASVAIPVPATAAAPADASKPSRLNPFGRAPKADNKPADAAAAVVVPALASAVAAPADAPKPSRLNPFGRAPKADNKPADNGAAKTQELEEAVPVPAVQPAPAGARSTASMAPVASTDAAPAAAPARTGLFGARPGSKPADAPMPAQPAAKPTPFGPKPVTGNTTGGSPAVAAKPAAPDDDDNIDLDDKDAAPIVKPNPLASRPSIGATSPFGAKPAAVSPKPSDPDEDNEDEPDLKPATPIKANPLSSAVNSPAASGNTGSRLPFGARPTLGAAAAPSATTPATQSTTSPDDDDDDAADTSAADKQPATPAAKPSSPFGAGSNRPSPFGKPAAPVASTGTSAAVSAASVGDNAATSDKTVDEPAATVAERSAANRPSPFGAPKSPFGKPAASDAKDDLDDEDEDLDDKQPAASLKPAAPVSTPANRPSPFGAPKSPFGKPATPAASDAKDDLDDEDEDLDDRQPAASLKPAPPVSAPANRPGAFGAVKSPFGKPATSDKNDDLDDEDEDDKAPATPLKPAAPLSAGGNRLSSPFGAPSNPFGKPAAPAASDKNDDLDDEDEDADDKAPAAPLKPASALSTGGNRPSSPFGAPANPFGKPAAPAASDKNDYLDEDEDDKAPAAPVKPAAPLSAGGNRPSSPFGAPSNPFGKPAAPAATDKNDDLDDEDEDDKAPAALKPATPINAGGNRPSPFGAPKSPFGKPVTPAASDKNDDLDDEDEDDKAPATPFKPVTPIGTAANRAGPFGAKNPFSKPAAPAASDKNDDLDDEDEADDKPPAMPLKPATPIGNRPLPVSTPAAPLTKPVPKPGALSKPADEDKDEPEEEDEPKYVSVDEDLIDEDVKPPTGPRSPFGSSVTAAPGAKPAIPTGARPASSPFGGSPFKRPEPVNTDESDEDEKPAPKPELKPEPAVAKAAAETVAERVPEKVAEPIKPQAAAPTPVSAPASPAKVEPPVAPLAPAAKVEAPIKVETAAVPPLEGVIIRSKSPSGWEIPAFSELLEPGSQQKMSEEALNARAHVIEETLQSFGAPGKVIEINSGPTITQFGVEPDYLVSRQGKRTRVKVSSIAKLDADLALALAARSIRIEAPVPGKGYVGIEVPNDQTALVGLRDIMASPEFEKVNSKLRIGLGQSTDGVPITADMTQMPHLLIAGTTGSGKSVCVNAIIACLLLMNTPDDLKLIMVDPKRVELTGYNGIPHLVSPVVVDLERIVGVLKWVTREMEERYKKFSQAGARNIIDYNSKLGPSDPRLPYLVVIIDELADLMMLAPDETEKVLTRLAQMARATGIHLILSTQRPSVDVVTGLIKANFPARISFAVASSVDSRVILDQPGAEKLLGRGDMLFQSPEAAAPVRMQGVFVSDAEINRITRYWKNTRNNSDEPKPTPSNNIFDVGSKPAEPAPRPVTVGGPGSRPNGSPVSSPSSGMRPAGNPSAYSANRPVSAASPDSSREDDEMYDEAVDLVKRANNKASISLLQRRLKIGYNRAARLIDLMEKRGVISKDDVTADAD